MEGSVAVVTSKKKQVTDLSKRVNALARKLADADDPADIVDLEAEIEAIWHLMRAAGLYDTAEIRPVNEMRMRARWKLGRALAKEDRCPGPGRGKKGVTGLPSFKAFLQKLGLSKPTAVEAQRIGALPDDELEKAFAEARDNDIMSTFDDLIDRARPYWYKENRKKKHQAIARAAKATLQEAGPFSLIYADPPWRWGHFGQDETVNEKGASRTPEQHYKTLTDEEIMAFKVRGMRVADIAHEDAALLLWCTSSNVHRALEIMKWWEFEFKASAVWIKDKGGMGLIFRNWHEILLYGTRGKMPGPQYQPPSAFKYSRGKHSAKPPEIRKEIEKMYPDFDKATRLELFARGKVEGWSTYGLEAG